jgi:branched-chain amino acid transport system substrate-binding protein
MSRKCRSGVAVMATTLLIAGGASAAEKKYEPGVSDTEIKLGQTVPYSGPASAFSSYGRTMTGYFQMINDGGGIKRPQDQSDFARQRLQPAEGD